MSRVCRWNLNLQLLKLLRKRFLTEKKAYSYQSTATTRDRKGFKKLKGKPGM
jgi:hypothetical protein